MTYPPSKLYKYYEIKDFLPKILNGESLKFSCPFDFNDPFESRYCYQIDDSKDGGRFIHEKVKRHISNPSKRITESQRIKNRFKAPRSLEDDDVFNEVIRQVGVFCLSEVNDSILMWSHYANEHKGICIGFDTGKSMFQLAWQVKYQEEFPIILRPKDNEEILLNKSLLTKAGCWSYEKEWRIIKRTLTLEEKNHSLRRGDLSDEDIRQLTNGRGPGDYSFPKEAIKEIYLGARIEAEQRIKVIQYVRDANLNIPVYEARRNSHSYSLGFDPIKLT
ncbi:MAG: DUF2971 domain-containing protein [Cellvibrio sp.]|uniref:DUF2971 domain-containing protein n=1 Tax=Cellvibrio sp. TaxID=1965322 RepID=UPI002716194C|nr:DUF2971 domain-containing protein [Cellvibrio sp.]